MDIRFINLSGFLCDYHELVKMKAEHTKWVGGHFSHYLPILQAIN